MADEELLQFPCDIPIKVFGRNEADFQRTAYDIVKTHIATVSPENIRAQESREGRFVSLTINVHVESRAQVDAIYTELSAHESVLMVL